MLLRLQDLITWAVFLQIFCQGLPFKKAFRHAKVRSDHAVKSLKSHGKLRKEPVKNALGKGKSSFEFDLDNFDADRNFRDVSHDYISFYQNENRLDKMHVPPVHEGGSVNVNEPHLGFNYRYNEGETRHEPHHRVVSYAGEMIDDENTLSKFIAPPVFENHDKKLHQQQATKILYGTPEAQSAENANTKSLLDSLTSVMSPLSGSNYGQKSFEDFESNQDGDSYGAKEKSNIEYEGKYKVVNQEVERASEEYNHGNEENGIGERKFYGNDERNFVRDYGEYENGNNEEINRESSKRRDSFDSDRDNENRRGYYEDRMEDDHPRSYNREKNNNHIQEDSAQYGMAESRSPENHEKSRDDGYDQHGYDTNRFMRHGEDEEDNLDQEGGKPIEVVQDNSGKLHPMTNNISNEELNNEVSKYMGHNSRN